MDPNVVPLEPVRMLLGEGSPLFLVEIALRTVLLYGWLLLCLRFVGRRALSQLSIMEFGIVIALGSAAGDGLFYAEVPLVHAMLVVFIVVLLQNALAHLVNKSERVETLVEGRPVLLVEDGRVHLDGLERVRSSTEELFELLRLRGVAQLGQVRFAFMEQSGGLSVFVKKAGAPPGLPIVPPFDLVEPRKVDDAADIKSLLVCTTCGVVREKGTAPAPHPRCAHPRWTHASVETFD